MKIYHDWMLHQIQVMDSSVKTNNHSLCSCAMKIRGEAFSYFLLLFLSSVKTQTPVGLKVLASLRGISIGSAFRVRNVRNFVDDGRYEHVLRENYQIVVPEYELKPINLWIDENRYNWDDSDWLLGSTPNETGWIQQNGFIVRGHTLVWAIDQWIPEWLLKRESTVTPEKARCLLRDYIHTVVTRYRGKFHSWDVINEAIDDKNNSRPFNLRDCFWFRKLGPDFLKYSLIFAHEADPDVELYYNDYGIESLGLKAERVQLLVDWLKCEGVILHGIGMQWHIDVRTILKRGDGYYRNAQNFIDQNLKLMITELDVFLETIGGYPVDSKNVYTQGLVYSSIVRYALHFSPHIQALVTWGFTDRYHWISDFYNYTKGAALPIDWMYLPKLAYWRIQEELSRILSDGKYVISPLSHKEKCLGIGGIQGTDKYTLQLYDKPCLDQYQRWAATWLNDGTYRLSSLTDPLRFVITVNSAIGSSSQLEIKPWTNQFSQEWILVPEQRFKFKIVTRTSPHRVLSVYNSTNLILNDNDRIQASHWTFSSVLV